MQLEQPSSAGAHTASNVRVRAPELSLGAETRWSHKLDKFYCGYHSDLDPGFLHRAVRPHVGLSRAELIGMREDEREAGGYFITNGSERIVRQLQVPRRHYPMALVRTAFLKRGSSLTTFAVAYWSVRADERSQTILVHALKDGSCVVRVLIAKKEFFMPLPLILRALVDTTDRDIYESILGEDSDYSFVIERIEAMLHDFHQYRLFRRDAVLRYLGQHMRSVLGLYDCEGPTDADVGKYFVRSFLFGLRRALCRWLADYTCTATLRECGPSEARGTSLPKPMEQFIR